MIVSLEGILAATGPGYVVVNVGGVGLQAFVPTSTLSAIGGAGQQVRLHTHLHVQENLVALYGFATADELRLFGMLMNVSGVGPKIALKMLSVMKPNELVTAIANEDTDALVRIPGIGRKTAARLSLELKGTLEKEWAVAPGAVAAPADNDAVAALAALGYSPAEARAALAGLEDGIPLEEKVTLALQRVGAGRRGRS